MARDNNRVPTAYGVSSADPNVLLPLLFSPVTGRLLCKFVGNTGDNGQVLDIAPRDQNYIPVKMGVRSDNGNATPLNIHATNKGLMMEVS